MKDKCFLDTNIIVYAFDPSSPDKLNRAQSIISENNWVISWQVIQEFCNVALHRFQIPLKQEDLQDYLDLVLWPRCALFPSAEIYDHALKVQQMTQYRFYDALVVSSALASGASVLYSEDLQAGRQFDSLIIRNPFK
jgi:predicted nucleic acid-binding protein